MRSMQFQTSVLCLYNRTIERALGNGCNENDDMVTALHAPSKLEAQR